MTQTRNNPKNPKTQNKKTEPERTPPPAAGKKKNAQQKPAPPLGILKKERTKPQNFKIKFPCCLPFFCRGKLILKKKIVVFLTKMFVPFFSFFLFLPFSFPFCPLLTDPF